MEHEIDYDTNHSQTPGTITKNLKKTLDEQKINGSNETIHNSTKIGQDTKNSSGELWGLVLIINEKYNLPYSGFCCPSRPQCEK